MKQFYSFTLCLFCFFQAQNGFSQNTESPCGADYWRTRTLEDPVFFQKNEEYEQNILQVFEQKKDNLGLRGQVKVLPTVVHIIHNGGPENITDAQVQQAIAWLNQALANQGPFDQGSGANSGIQLCLAQRTPDGQPSNGITRDQSPLTEMQLETQDLQVKNLERWEPKDYVNIWLVRSICSINYGCGIYGYSNYPFAHGSNIDGIVIEASYLTEVGKITGLAHEMGHYLGLYHSFEGGCNNNNCLVDGDRICDTPPDQSTAGVPCTETVSTCATDAQSGPFTTDQQDMSWNFMDYGIIACFHDYTPDQATRMNATLDGVRHSLLDSKGCLPPCPANTIAGFTPSAVSVAMGSTVTFTNTSQNASAYTWTVDGIPFSSQNNAAFTFPAPGAYSIVLEVQPTNNTLCSPDQSQATIEVYCPVTASFTISNTGPNENETVFLSNTSQNASQTEWYINGVSQGATLDSLNFSAAGAYEIRLITGNGVCGDTATDFVYVQTVCLQKTFALTILTEGSSQSQISTSTVTLLTDGNILVAGNKIDFSSSDESPYFVKMKPNGEVIWAKEVGFDSTLNNSIIARATPDGGYVAFWGEGTLIPQVGQYYLAKFSANGALVWAQKIPWDFLAATAIYVDLYIHPDGSIVVCGPFLAKFTDTGSLLWVKNYAPLRSLISYPGGGYLALNNSDIIRFDAMGNRLWQRKIIAPITIQPQTLLALPDGSIYVAGLQQSPTMVSLHGALFKLDQDGELLWSRSYRQIPLSTYQFEAITRSTNGNLVLAGHSISDDPGPANFNMYELLLEVDLDGNVVWSQHRPFNWSINNTDDFTDIISMPSGGYFVVTNITPGNFRALKTDEFGKTIGCPESPHDINVTDFNFTSLPDSIQTNGIVLDLESLVLPVTDILWYVDTSCTPACLQSFEICNNNLDDDGDGLFDCLDSECSCSEDRCAPKQASIWYFGYQAGLDFRSDPPTVLGNGKARCDGISATMCDVKGNVLFYTDGLVVYNRFHQPMPNGIFSIQDTVYQSIIIPNPQIPNTYFVVVNYPGGGIYSSVVDMTLQGGNGDLVEMAKNIRLEGLSSGLAAVKACSFDGYWLLTRSLEQSSNFYAFKINQFGLFLFPISSNMGQSVGSVQQIKISPDGARVACTYRSADTDHSFLAIYNFDPNSSGLVSNPLILGEYSGFNFALGVEFSPNGRFLYATGTYPGNVKLLQFDLEAGDLQAIKNSMVKLATLPGQGMGYPQLGADGKIYISALSSTLPPPNYALNVIHKPNLKGLSCQYAYQGLDISNFAPEGGASFGLCNIISSYFLENQSPTLSLSSLDTICELNTPVHFQLENLQCGVDSVIWKTENLNTQIQPNYQSATIRFLAPGTGRLIVTAYTPCGSATDTLDLLVVAPLNKTIDLGPDIVVCQNGVFSFNAGSGFARYQWSDGTADSTVTTLFPGKYWVNAWDLCGNLQTDTITVTIAPNSVLDLGPDLPQQCSGVSATYQRPANFASWQWSPSDFLSCADCPSVTVSPTSSTNWVVYAQTVDGCISVDSLSATIRDTLLFSRDTFVCEGQTIALYGAHLPADTTAQILLPAPGLGCDTLITVHVLGIENASNSLSATICANAFYEYNGVLLPADTVAVFHLWQFSRL